MPAVRRAFAWSRVEGLVVLVLRLLRLARLLVGLLVLLLLLLTLSLLALLTIATLLLRRILLLVVHGGFSMFAATAGMAIAADKTPRFATGLHEMPFPWDAVEAALFAVTLTVGEAHEDHCSRL